MAAKGVSYIKWKKTPGRCFMTALSSALLEWLLILMLLMNGLFTYLITCFARYCDLPIPCLLCSRFDHVFGSQRAGSYWDLMCKSHKSEISSLVLCTLHQRLVDVHGMCENCLFSFATKDKTNPETCRLLVGKMRIDSDNGHKPVSNGEKICCCCSEPWSSRSHAQALLQTKSIDAPLTRELRLNWSSSKKENKMPFFVAARSDLHESFEDCSPHFGYSELKLNSDSESDDQICEIESSNLNDHDTAASEKPIIQDSTLMETPNLIDDWMKPEEDTVAAKPIAVVEPPNLVDHELSHSDSIESNGAPSTLPDPVGHGLEELNWQDIDLKLESSAQSDHISTNNVLESANAAETEVDPSKDHVVSDIKDIEAPIQIEQAAISEKNETEKEPATTDVLDSKNNEVINGGVQPANTLELVDAYKLALSSRGRQLSGKTLEQLIGKDSTRLSEDLKLLLSQLSIARGLDLPLTGMISPRISGNLGSSLHRRMSLERNDSRNSVESLDISSVSEIDGEGELERLRRQIEHDKRFTSALYKELEEERNASAVAANQALAMITRLQEEKAALQMEALHDLRMMEDQAEYDVEALERANEILADKEKEIQDLEAELDYYRLKYPDDELVLENEEMILRAEELDTKSSWLGFEDERLYISQRLSNLEKKLHLFSNTGFYPDLQNGDCFKMEEEKKAGDSGSFGVRRSLVRRVNSLKNPKSIGQDSLVHKEADVASLGCEVSTLNERLQALEADRNFLEHAINSLRNGEEGVRFLREIASHLQELRRVGIKRKQSLA